MKLLSCLKYGLLAVHVAASGSICMMADTALRSMLVLSGVRSSQARSLQFVLLALLEVGVLVSAALADRRFSQAKNATALLTSACGVFALHGAVFGLLALIPALYGLLNWFVCISAFLLSAAFFVGCALLFRSRNKTSVKSKQNF